MPVSPIPASSTMHAICCLPLSLHPNLLLQPTGVLSVLPTGKLLNLGSDSFSKIKKAKNISICTVLYIKAVSTITIIYKSLLWFSY